MVYNAIQPQVLIYLYGFYSSLIDPNDGDLFLLFAIHISPSWQALNGGYRGIAKV
jgi:hypothetical protein